LIRLSSLPPKNLRPWLLDDEKGETTAKVKKMKEEGFVVLGTFKWNNKGRRTSFWLRNDVIEEMRQIGKWKIYLWRTDT